MTAHKDIAETFNVGTHPAERREFMTVGFLRDNEDPIPEHTMLSRVARTGTPLLQHEVDYLLRRMDELPAGQRAYRLVAVCYNPARRAYEFHVFFYVEGYEGWRYKKERMTRFGKDVLILRRAL